MSRLHAIWKILPRSARSRMVSAFMLMAAFPILGALLVVYDQNATALYGAIAMVLVPLFCAALAVIGVCEFNSLLMSVMNMKDFARDIVGVQAAMAARGVNCRNVARLQTFIGYMSDQIESARKLIWTDVASWHRQGTDEGVPIPPLFSGTELVKRLKSEFACAQLYQGTVGLICCMATDDAKGPAVAESVPAWLQEGVAATNGAFSFLGVREPHCWIGCLDPFHSVCSFETALQMYQAITAVPGRKVDIKVWRYPRDSFDLNTEIVGGVSV